MHCATREFSSHHVASLYPMFSKTHFFVTKYRLRHLNFKSLNKYYFQKI